MLQVINYRQFQGKKDPNKTFHVVDLLAENGQIVVDQFVDGPLEIGSYCTVTESVVNHKLFCKVIPVAKKQ